MYANSRAHLLSCIMKEHHTGPLHGAVGTGILAERVSITDTNGAQPETSGAHSRAQREQV